MLSPSPLTRGDIADIVQRFVDDRPRTADEWDDFLYFRLRDTLALEVQALSIELPNLFPPRSGVREYCSPEGRTLLRDYIARLRAEPLVRA